MLELILTVCTIVQGANCRTEPLMQSQTGMVGCLIASQIEGAKWVQQNPNYYIQKMTCRPAKMLQTLSHGLLNLSGVTNLRGSSALGLRDVSIPAVRARKMSER